MLADNAVASAQAKADALAYTLSGVERIEDVFRLQQSASTVGEFDFDLLVHDAQGDDKRTRTLFFHGIDAIADDLKKDLENAAGISRNAGNLAF